MKITIRLKKSKEEIAEKITVNNVEPGTVFKFNNDIVSLKLQDGKVIHLNFWGDELILSDDSLNYKNIEILGRLDEIIVVKE